MLHGVDLDSSGWTPALVGQRLDRVDGLISFVTRRSEGFSHEWLSSEFTMALDREIDRLQIVLEDGEQLPGPLQGRPAILFNRTRPLPAFSNLTHQRSAWAREAGRPTWVRLEHGEIANVLVQHPASVCRYRFLQSRTGDQSDWHETPLRKINHQVRVRLQWPEDHDFVMLQLADGEEAIWETSWQPQLVYIRQED